MHAERALACLQPLVALLSGVHAIMKKTILTLVVTGSIAALSVSAACAADIPVNRARQVGGSIVPTTVQNTRVGTQVRRVDVSRAASADDNAVCIGTDPSACGTQGEGRDGPSPLPLAFCDVESMGFTACLASYAPAVVNHPAPARQVFSVTLRNHEGNTRTVTVLLAGAQTAQDAATMALEGSSDETVVGVD